MSLHKLLPGDVIKLKSKEDEIPVRVLRSGYFPSKINKGVEIQGVQVATDSGETYWLPALVVSWNKPVLPTDPVFLRFEDWSWTTGLLDQKGISHGDHVIKVYPSLDNPRMWETSIRDTAFVVAYNGSVFADEVFSFTERGLWTGKDLNAYIATLKMQEDANRCMRALFRFSFDRGFCQSGMSLKNPLTGEFVISHPLDEIDGLTYATQKMPELLHLDIFLPESLEKLFAYVSGKPETYNSPILSFDESKSLHRNLRLQRKLGETK